MEKQKWYDAVLASLDRMKNIHDLVENEFRNTVQRLLYSADGIARPDDFAVTASAPPDGYVVIPAHTAVQGGQMIAVDTPESVPVLITPIGKPAPFAGSGLNRYTSIFVRYLDGVDRVEGDSKAEWFVDDTTSPPTPYQDTVDTLYLDDYEVIVRHSADAATPTPVSTPVGYIRYADVYVGQGVIAIAADKITTTVSVYGALDELIYKVNNKVVSWGEITDKPSTFAPSAHTMDGTAHTGTLNAARHGTVSGTGLHPFTSISGTITDTQHGTRGHSIVVDPIHPLATTLTLHPLATTLTPGFMSADDKKAILANMKFVGQYSVENGTIVVPANAQRTGLLIFMSAEMGHNGNGTFSVPINMIVPLRVEGVSLSSLAAPDGRYHLYHHWGSSNFTEIWDTISKAIIYTGHPSVVVPITGSVVIQHGDASVDHSPTDYTVKERWMSVFEFGKKTS